MKSTKRGGFLDPAAEGRRRKCEETWFAAILLGQSGLRRVSIDRAEWSGRVEQNMVGRGGIGRKLWRADAGRE
ncbi:MAG: hypothetical protein ACP5E5_00400 [Acidobacteriaceae bacterium]